MDPVLHSSGPVMPPAASLDIGEDTTGIVVRTPAPRSRSPKPPPVPAKRGPVAGGKKAARGSASRSVVDELPSIAEEPAKARRSKAGKADRQARAAAKAAQRRAKTARSARRVSVAWFLLLLVMTAGGVAGFYMFEQWQSAEEDLKDARLAAVASNERVADAEQRVIQARAALTRQRAEVDKLRADIAGVTARADKAGEKADELAQRLEDIVGSQGTVTKDKSGKLTLEMVDKVLFRSGEAELTDKGEKVLSSVGEALKKFPEKQIWVQGHTDDIPIANDQFASNWELSSARAMTVVHYLEDVAEVDPRRLAAVGFGEHRPVSRSKRFRNRRIEIVLFPRDVQLIKD